MACTGIGGIATGKDAHHKSWQDYFAQTPAPPPDDASPTVQMAYALRTEIGQAIYRLRKCTVEPIIGILKETLGFRQFSLRGLEKATGEWSLVCLTYDLKRLYVLQAHGQMNTAGKTDQPTLVLPHLAGWRDGRCAGVQQEMRRYSGRWIYQRATA